MNIAASAGLEPPENPLILRMRNHSCTISLHAALVAQDSLEPAIRSSSLLKFNSIIHYICYDCSMFYRDFKFEPIIRYLIIFNHLFVYDWIVNYC